MKCELQLSKFSFFEITKSYKVMKGSLNVGIVIGGAASANMIAVASPRGVISMKLMADFISPQITFGLTLL